MSVAVVLWDSDPLVPVTVSVDEPVGVPGDADTVTVVVPELVTVAGLKEAVAPAGKPDVVKLTIPLNPFEAVTVRR